MNKDDKTRIGATLYAAFLKTRRINRALEVIADAKKTNLHENPGTLLAALTDAEVALEELDYMLNRLIDLHANDAGFDPRNKKEN